MGNREVQRTGEAAAAGFLESRGYRILHRNWRIKAGELDIVASHRGTLVFVEVKARTRADFADPALSVDGRKRERLRKVAGAYLAFERPGFEACRFDVVSVTLGAGRPSVRHIPDAF